MPGVAMGTEKLTMAEDGAELVCLDKLLLQTILIRDEATQNLSVFLKRIIRIRKLPCRIPSRGVSLPQDNAYLNTVSGRALFHGFVEAVQPRLRAGADMISLAREEIKLYPTTTGYRPYQESGVLPIS
jgi:hypothetical protein